MQNETVKDAPFVKAMSRVVPNLHDEAASALNVKKMSGCFTIKQVDRQNIQEDASLHLE